MTTYKQVLELFYALPITEQARYIFKAADAPANIAAAAVPELFTEESSLKMIKAAGFIQYLDAGESTAGWADMYMPLLQSFSDDKNLGWSSRDHMVRHIVESGAPAVHDSVTYDELYSAFCELYQWHR